MQRTKVQWQSSQHLVINALCAIKKPAPVIGDALHKPGVG
jgi:hypothetical protein